MTSAPTFHGGRCVRYRYRYSRCSRCADACPHDALTLTDEGVTINDARCERCALCASSCRTEALAADNLPWGEFVRQALKQERFAFACTPSGEEGDAMAPCLGALNAGMLSFLAVRGVAVELRGSGHCERCHHAPRGHDLLTMNLDGVEALRRTVGDRRWGRVTLAAPSDGAPARHRAPYMASRRQLFRRAVNQGVTRFIRPVLEEPKDPAPDTAIRSAAPFTSLQRELLQTLKPDEMHPDALSMLHPAVPMARVEVSPGCTACEACARVCPTGALWVSESSDSWMLEFQFSRCVACDVCAEACRPGVLKLHDVDRLAFAMDESEPLYRLSKERCFQCARYFISDGKRNVCKVCGDDDQDFAQLFG